MRCSSISCCLNPIFSSYNCSFSEIITSRRNFVLRSPLFPPMSALPRSLKSSVGSVHVKGIFDGFLLKLGGHNILTRNSISFLAAISATWIFCSAIPAVLALKRRAEKLQKLFDAKTNELPQEMVAVQSSCMEISGLTTEINNLREEITPGFRHSKATVPLANEVLGVLNDMDASVMAKETVPPTLTVPTPVLAMVARTLREMISRVRASLKLVLLVSRAIRLSRSLIPSHSS